MKFSKFLLLSFLLYTGQLRAQNDPTALISLLNDQIVKVNSFSPEGSLDDMKFFDGILKDKKIIALGEGTHGTKEIFLYKDRLIRYLVTKHNVKYILIESDMIGLEKLNEYVLSEQPANLKYVMSESGIFGIYYTQEVADMIEWLKGFNRGKPLLAKVKFKGMDMQTPHHIFQALIQTKVFMNNLSDNNRGNLIAYNKYISGKDSSFSKDQINDLKAIAKELKGILKTVKGTDTLERLTLYLQLFDQIISLQNLHPYMYSYLRDKNMAENVAFLAEHSQPEEKVVIWAHNGHISNHLLIKHKAMGMRLKEKFGNKYYSLGIGVADGYSRLYELADINKVFKSTKLLEVSNPNSIEYIFKLVKAENFFLQISDNDFKEPLKDFIIKPKQMVAIGPMISAYSFQNWSTVILKKAFDGFVFFRNTTAATDIK